MSSSSLGWKDYYVETRQLHVPTERDKRHYLDDKLLQIIPLGLSRAMSPQVGDDTPPKQEAKT